MSRLEIVSPEGLRVDGRRPNELRRINSKLRVFAEADGSAYLEQGNTKCLALVFGPREPQKKSMALFDKAAIKVEFSVASFSTGERRDRSKKDRKLFEMEIAIKNVFESVLVSSQFPRSEISIYIQILQTDGGILHTAINATTLALVDAGIPMTDYVCACSAGFANDRAILELNYIEESSEVPTLTLALTPRTGEVALVELESKLHHDYYQQVFELATSGCQSTFEILDVIARKATESLAATATMADLITTYVKE